MSTATLHPPETRPLPAPSRLPAAGRLLVIVLVLEGLSAVAGGVAFLLDTSGGIYGMGTDLLEPTPIDTFLAPGLYLLLVIGLGPILVGTALARRPPVAWLRWLERRTGEAWPVTAATLMGLAIVAWITVQMYVIADGVNGLQAAYLATGAVVVVLSRLPSVRRHFTL